MDTHPYYGPGGVVIDICEPCSLIWLDQGELSRIRTAPERRRKPERWLDITEVPLQTDDR